MNNRFPFEMHGATGPVYLEADEKRRPPVIIVLKGPGGYDTEWPYVRVVS